MVFWSFLGFEGILVIFLVSRVFDIFGVSGVFWSFWGFGGILVIFWGFGIFW